MDYDYTFLLPCLNEEKSLKVCIEEIKETIKRHSLNAEILVADNNSTDNSRKIAEENGARIIVEKKVGYGSALIAGTKAARGKYCIMGDSDGSYDFTNIKGFLDKINDKVDLVVGNRYISKQSRNTMKMSHIIGGRALSIIGNMVVHSNIKDYNCGLRVYNREKILSLNLEQEGMEYATEMIMKAKINKLNVSEEPTIMRNDLRRKKVPFKTNKGRN